MSGDAEQPLNPSRTDRQDGHPARTGRPGQAVSRTRGARQKRPELPDGLPTPRRYWAVLTLMSVLIVTVLDSTMVNVALPTIARDLNIPAAEVVRVVLAYNLALVVTLLPFSAMAERIGFRTMFSVGLVVFGLASLSSALSTSLVMLLLSRVAQGLGSSMLMCLFGGLVRNIYPLRKLSLGLSLNASMVGVTAVMGPTIGAWILALASWPWIFLLNLPICVLAFFGVRFLPDVPRAEGRFDWTAALLSTVAIGLAVIGLDAVANTSLSALVYFAGSVAFAYYLLKRSFPQPAPLVPIDLLRIVAVRYAVASSLVLFAAQMGGFVAFPFYFQQVLGYSYTELGITLGAWPIGAAIMSPIAAYFSERYSVALLCGIGATCVGLGLSGLLLLPNDGAFMAYMLVMFVAGVGFGFFQTPNNRAMLSGAPRRRSGAAGGLQAVTRVFGQTLGTALVAIAFALGGGYGPAFGVGVAIACAAIAVLINIARYRNPVPDPLPE